MIQIQVSINLISIRKCIGDGEYLVACVDASHGWLKRKAEFEQAAFRVDLTMDSLIEIQRQTHEDIERFERALYTLLSRPQATHSRNLQNEHKASQILDRLFSRIVTLNDLYNDEDARKKELDALSAQSHQNDLSEFYERLNKIQEHHNKYPDAVPLAFDFEIATFLEEPALDGDEDFEEEDRMCSPTFTYLTY